MFKKILILLCIGLAAYIFWPGNMSNPPEMGKVPPMIEAQLITGEDFRLDQLKGKYVLLDFWASWCGPCRREASSLVDLHVDYSGKSFNKGDGFEIVSIALEKSKGSSLGASKKHGFPWKYQIEDAVLMVRLSKFAQDYNVTSIPTKFLLNPKGEIVLMNPSAGDVSAYLSEELK